MSTISSKTISYSQFAKVGLIIGKTTKVTVNANAKIPAYLLELDLGSFLLEEHTKTNGKNGYISSAQLRANHTEDDLLNQKIMCVYNFPRKQIGSMKSDCLVTGAQAQVSDPEEKRKSTVFMKSSDPNVPAGSKIGILAAEELYQFNPRNLEWNEFTDLDLRIATVLSCRLQNSICAENEEKEYNSIFQHLEMEVDLGLGRPIHTIARMRKDFDGSSLLGRQVLVLNNLSAEDIAIRFNSTATAVLCTIAGKAFIEPAIKTPNGYKIA